jgi:TP901 family phage tail tape measure protein
MADVNANIGVNIDTSNALAQIKSLQRQLSQFYTSIAKSSETAALAQRDLQRNLINSVNSLGVFSAEMRTIKTTSESFTDSLEKNKFSMREYFRYAGASTRTFGKLFRSEFDTISKVAEENVKRLQTQYIKLGRDSSGAMKAIAVIPRELNMDDYGTKTQIAAQKQALFNQLVKQGSTNLLNFGKNTQWAGRQLMVGFTIPLTILGNTAARTFMEMETAALKFRKVYGDLFTPTQEREQALADVQALGQAFTKYGIAVSATTNLAAEAAAAGFQGLDLQRQVTEATRLQVLGQVEQQKALETTISLQNAFAMSSEDLSDAINFLNAVENQTVVSLDDITTAIPKAAPVVKQLGGDVRDLAFFMAAMKEGGINASEGANALKSGLASLINPTDKASEMLAGFGINIKSIVEKNAGNVKQTVIDFALALDNLSDLNRQRAIEQLFGKFQLARLSTLFENVTKSGNQASRVLDLATASTEDLASMAESELGMTAESAMNKFRKAVEDLKFALVPVGKAFLESVTPIAEFLGDILEKFNNLSDGAKKAITVLTVGIGAIGPVALMTFGLLANGLANGIKFLQILRNGYLRLTGQSQVLSEQTQFLTIEQQNAAAVAHSLDQSHARLTQTFTLETAALRNLVAAYNTAIGAAQRFAMTNPGMMMPPRAKGYANGVVSVPGPKGAGDIVPAMLSPGEAVIPAKMAKKYGGLINGMIADNIPGFKDGIKSMYGGQERFMAPYTMFAPGNTPGGFGMSKDFLESAGFAQSLRNTAIVSGSIEANMRLTDKAMMEMADQVVPFTNKITDQLRLAAKEMANSGKAATHISQLFDNQRDEIKNILNQLSATGARGAGMAEGLRKTFYPTDEDIRSGGNVRVPGVDVDEQGRIVRAAPRSLRTGAAARFQRGLQRVRDRLPIEGTGTMTRAHVVPESRVLAGGVRPIAGGALAMPMEAQMAARAELQRRSAILSEKLGRSDAFSYEAGRKSTGLSDMYVESRKRNSPHPMASKDGKDDAIAYSTARDQELTRRSRRGRRVATSAGGTVGPGGVILGGGGTGGGGGGTFLGMPGMPERRRSFRDRFRNVGSKFGSGRYAGAGMAASMGVMAASMAPGPVGEIASKAMPAVFGLQALQMALKLPIPHIKLFAAGIAGTIGLIKLVNSARERERQSIEGLADAATLTKDKIATLGDFFGVVPQTTPFEADVPQVATVTSAQRAQLDQLKQSEGFQKQFGKDIANLRKATAKEAELVFKSLSIALQGKGFATQQIQTIIDALREESGKTDVVIDVKSLKLNTKEGQAGLKQTAESIAAQFSTAFSTGLEEKMVLTGGVGAGGRGFSQWVSQMVPTKELKKQSKAAAQEISNLIIGISGQFKNGQISADQFNQSFANIEKVITDLNKSNPAAALMLMENVMGTLPPKLQKVVAGVKSLEGNMLLLKMQSLGMTGAIAGVAEAFRTLENPLSDISDRIKAQLLIDATTKNVVANAKKIEEAIKKALGAGTGGGTGEESAFSKLIKQLKSQRTEITNSITAFNKLRAAGVGISKALELSKDPLMAMVLSSKLTKDQFKQILDLVNKLNDAASRGALKDYLEGIAGQNQLQAQFNQIIPKLREMGLRANEIEELMGNPDLMQGIIDGLTKGGNKAQLLKQLIDQIVARRVLEIDMKLKTPEGQMEIFEQGYGEAMDFFDKVYAAMDAELQANTQYQDAIKNIADAQAEIDALNDSIATKQQLISELQYDLEYNETYGQGVLDAIEGKIAAENAIIDGINQQIEAVQRQIDQEQKAIDAINEQIDQHQSVIDKLNRQIEIEFERPINALQEESDRLSNTLTLIERQEDEINKKYDAQEQALQRISDINEDIANQKKQQISLADALTQGDISAAAQIAQEMRAANAESALKGQQNALAAGRQAELAAVTINGMTRAQIEERQFQIGQQIYALEQQRLAVQKLIIAEEDKIYQLKLQIEPYEKKIADLNKIIEGHKANIALHEANIQRYETEIARVEALREPILKRIKDYEKEIEGIRVKDIPAAEKRLKDAEQIKKDMEAQTEAEKKKVTYLEKNRKEWEQVATQVAAAKASGEGLSEAMGVASGYVSNIVDKWNSLKPYQDVTISITENVTRYITEVITQIINQVPGSGSGGSGGSSGGGSGGGGAGGGTVALAFGGKVKRRFMARGGRTLGSDIVPAMLTPGEFVMNRAATARFEPLLNTMNQGGYPSLSKPRFSMRNGMGRNAARVTGPQYQVSSLPDITPPASKNMSTVVNNTSSPVYNYNLNVNVNGTNADPNAIANTVMTKIQQMQAQDIRRRVV